jgi:DNA-binding LacI/PurR family transcriptional regulator
MGCKLEAFHPKAQGISGARLTKMLRARGIEGVILGSSPRASAHATLDWPQFTIVAQGLSLLRPQVSRVAGDYAYNIRLTMHHLRRLGYKRIGFHLGAAEDLRCDQLWSGGFLAYQLRMPQEECIPLQIDQKTDVEAGRPALREWIRTWRPDVIITAGSYIVEWLRSAGYDVPGDIAVASMSLSRNSPLEHPALQGMGGLDQGFGRQGGVALDMLLSQMVTNQKGLPTERKRIFIQGEWIDGWSLPRKGPAAGPLQAWRTLICADAAEAPHSAAKWKPQA